MRMTKNQWAAKIAEAMDQLRQQLKVEPGMSLALLDLTESRFRKYADLDDPIAFGQEWQYRSGRISAIHREASRG